MWIENMPRKRETMARRLTEARRKKGLKVTHVVVHLNECRRNRDGHTLHYETVRRWFDSGLERVQKDFKADLYEVCRLLDIPSLDHLWRDEPEQVVSSTVPVSAKVFQLLPLLEDLRDEQLEEVRILAEKCFAKRDPARTAPEASG